MSLSKEEKVQIEADLEADVRNLMEKQPDTFMRAFPHLAGR